MKESLNDKYKAYCRPKVARLIETINLDKVYVKASGDYIYYKSDGKKPVKVLDFLGGYGASLFGHNHPDLIKVAKDNLNKMIPFNSQISTRHRAALLCEKLDEMMYSRTDKHFVTTLANSGTEGVEAAIKHAMLVQHSSNQYIHDELQKTLLKLSVANNNETFTYSENFLRLVVDKLDVNPDSLFDEHLWHVLNYNDQLFKRPPYIIALKKAFHGKTTGSVQLTFNKDYRMPFSRVSGKTIFVDPDKESELERAVKLATFHFYFPFINENNEIDIAEKKHCNITAMFIEPIQGEGGIQLISKEYMEYARKVATENHFPLIFDEIQCGMGRTGKFLASEHQGVVADYYILSKSLGGGLAKISAMLVQEKQYEDEFGFLHTSTFTEDDHSSDIALAALNLLDKDNSLYNNCQQRGDYLIKELNKLKEEYPDILDEVRGMGLMIGIQFKSQKDSNSTVLRVLSEQNLLLFVVAGYLLNEHQIRIAPTLSESNTIRVEPSAYITEEECQRLIHALKMVCEIFFRENAYMLLRYTVSEKKRLNTDNIKDYISTDNHVQELVEKDIRKVAFVGHFISAKHFPLYDRSFVEFKDKELEQLLDKFHEVLEPQITDSIVVHSKTGDKIRFLFIAYMISSRIIEEYMKQHNVNPLRRKIESAVNIAVKNGCRVIGFGGYTSIVTRNAKSIITDNIALTTGNSYTVASGVEALHRAIKRKKIDTDTSSLA
ncbi:MAG: aminotransferase class III-fold pyridoxal phosphate-dependent enzyme, partial [Spirochaetota bacterium]|nr:aminotransferase class III-fold pyridoxal phosphate-dependent enzyme [Spirochaetota bacterium]